jgi:hypothetical protein
VNTLSYEFTAAEENFSRKKHGIDSKKNIHFLNGKNFKPKIA